MAVGTALLCGILYWLSEANVPYVTVWTVQKPLVCGWITGCLLGCPEKGALCGALISLLYLGYRSHGSSMPSDIALAGICAASAAAAGASFGLCAVCALPAGFLGILIWKLRLHCNAFFMKQTQCAIERGVFWRILIPSALMPSLFSAAVCVPVGTLFSFGTYRAVQLVLEFSAVPERLLQIFNTTGLLLCAAGILFSLFPIHRKSTAFSFLAGLTAAFISRSPLALLLLPSGLVCALYVSYIEKHAQLTGPDGSDTSASVMDRDPDFDPDFDFAFDSESAPCFYDPDFCPDHELMSEPLSSSAENPKSSKKKASLPEAFSSSSILPLAASNLLWILFVQTAYNTKLMMGQAAAAAFLPILNLIHPNDPAMQREVLERQCVYLNTQPELGSCLIGLLIALESQKPGAEPERIRAVRSTLMGVFGAIGDELFQCGWIPLLLVTVSDLVLRSYNAAVCVLLYCLLAVLSAAVLSVLSFRTGLCGDEMRLLDLLESDFFHRIRHTLNLLLPFLKGAALAAFLLFILFPSLGF